MYGHTTFVFAPGRKLRPQRSGAFACGGSSFVMLTLSRCVELPLFHPSDPRGKTPLQRSRSQAPDLSQVPLYFSPSETPFSFRTLTINLSRSLKCLFICSLPLVSGCWLPCILSVPLRCLSISRRSINTGGIMSLYE